MVTGLWHTHDPNFGSLSWFWRCKEHPCPLSPHLGLKRMLEIPDWGLAPWSSFGYGHWPLIYPWSKFWLSILHLKVQRTSMSFKSSFGALEDAGGSWLGFGILILIWIGLGTLLGSSLKLWSHSDQWELRYSQSRISTAQNYQAQKVIPRGWVGVSFEKGSAQPWMLEPCRSAKRKGFDIFCAVGWGVGVKG